MIAGSTSMITGNILSLQSCGKLGRGWEKLEPF
jgi:hypothetical protein